MAWKTQPRKTVGEETFKNYWLLFQNQYWSEMVPFLFKNNKDKCILRKVQFDAMGVEIIDK